jgi:transporter family-2 protein
VPEYLLMSFIFSVIGVGGFYFLILEIWVDNMMGYPQTKQIIVTMVISHFVLFDSPIKLIYASKTKDVVLLGAVIILINK